MPLPPAFILSPSALHDFSTCPRRFQLRYLLRQPWVSAAPNPRLDYEEGQRLGTLFHQILQQARQGLPIDSLLNQPQNAPLKAWYAAQQTFMATADLPSEQYAEQQFSLRVGGVALLGRFDLLAVERGKRAVIIDWKTESRPPSRPALQQQWQTRLYPFLLVEAGAAFNDGWPFAPEQVQILYWYAHQPDAPQIFYHTAKDHEATRQLLQAKIADIHALLDDTPTGQPFPLTIQLSDCRFCTYQSLCGRGSGAESPALEDAADPFLTLDIVDLEF